jgi:HEAT repeat protein
MIDSVDPFIPASEAMPMTYQLSPILQLRQAVALDDDAAAEAVVSTLGPDDEADLLALATDADPDRRWWGLRGLAAVGGADAAPILAAALSSADEGERAVAALGLGHLHDRAGEAVAALLPALGERLTDGSGLVRQAAADGLALCGEDAVPVLVAALESEHEGVRVRAAAALRKLQSMRAAGALYQHLNDPNHLVRLYAYETLDAMGLLTNILLRR